MTAQRQEGNGPHSLAGLRRGIALIPLLASLLWGSLVWGSLAALAFSGVAVQAATTERVVVNRFTGLAIEGFDPVAYFVDAQPLIGQEGFEVSEAGAVWRFRNEGNRASFLAHPEVYGPRFGGYDPMDLARGVTVAGNPRFWLISGQRLYLFSREQNRDAFAADPLHFQQEATQRWPALRQDLAQ